MKKDFLILIYVCVAPLLFFPSCKKSAFLGAVPDQSLVVPASLSDFQAILDNDNIMNGSSRLDGLTPGFEEAGTDDYYALPFLTSQDIGYSNLYIWNDAINSVQFTDWDFGYRCVFYANEVLDGISKLAVNPSQQLDYNQVKGSALFYRAMVFWHLAQVFAPVYDSGTAKSDWGIPLRLTSDVNEAIQRATVQQTYDRVIGDLRAALALLPVSPLYKTRPSRPAVYGLLAKVFLSTGDYSNALLYADSCLQEYNILLDYNSVNASPSFPFSRFNGEVIFHAVMNQIVTTGIGVGRVDSLLYASYSGNDLRKTLFYRDRTGSWSFRGSYDNSNRSFSGIATDEMYLTRAEGYARMGNAAAAMQDLNTLLQSRWVTGTFVPMEATDANDALNKVLAERRKELVFRGTRFTDLRRLDKGGAGITLTRVLNGQTYTLPPNSLHYTYLIPPDVIAFNPGMPQNPR